MARSKYTQGKDGYYAARVWDGSRDENGRKHYVMLRTRKSSRELERMVSEYNQRVASGQFVKSSDALFLDYCREWLRTYKAVRERNTQAMYENVIRKHFAPLESVRVADLRKTHLQLIINSALDKPRTCQLIKLTFKQIINAAIDDKLLPEASLRTICSVALPKYLPTEKRALTDLEKRAIGSADFTPMQKAFVLIIYGCGLRRGEALALTRADILLARSELRVCRALEFVGNTPQLKGPKSANGIRTVPMPQFLTDFLRGYLDGLDGDFLFHTRYGSMMTATGYRRMWDGILKAMDTAAGGTEHIHVINGLTAHVFRHNYCTQLCYNRTLSTKKIAQLLGDTEKMVLDVYSHLLEEKEDAPAAVAAAIAL